MTAWQLSVLWRCAQTFSSGLHGEACAFAQQAGRMRQINWLLEHKLIRKQNGRFIATKDGRKILAYQIADRKNATLERLLQASLLV